MQQVHSSLQFGFGMSFEQGSHRILGRFARHQPLTFQPRLSMPMRFSERGRSYHLNEGPPRRISHDGHGVVPSPELLLVPDDEACYCALIDDGGPAALQDTLHLARVFGVLGGSSKLEDVEHVDWAVERGLVAEEGPELPG